MFLLQDKVEWVRSRLLNVRGVVSVTFQLEKNRAIVCTVHGLNPELLVSAVNEKDPPGCGDATGEQQQHSSINGAGDHGEAMVEDVRVRILLKRCDRQVHIRAHMYMSTLIHPTQWHLTCSQSSTW